jgi:hypothetical protein
MKTKVYEVPACAGWQYVLHIHCSTASDFGCRIESESHCDCNP